MKNTGKDYEALTEEVFRRLLSQELCADVKRDVKIPGRSTVHQIDVCFEFRAGGIPFRAIVQCKDWGAPVKQEQVLAFRSVLDDIPGQPRGIMVARSGFQEGARSVAAHQGIELYELRSPKDEDWDGLIRVIRLKMTVQLPDWRIQNLRIDKEWFALEMTRLGEPPDKTYRLHGTPSAWFTTSGSRVSAVELAQCVSPSLPDKTTGLVPVEHVFAEPLDVEGMEVEGVLLPRVRVLAISGEVQVLEETSELVVSADHLIACCFRDVLNGTVTFLDATGKRVTADKSEE